MSSKINLRHSYRHTQRDEIIIKKIDAGLLKRDNHMVSMLIIIEESY